MSTGQVQLERRVGQRFDLHIPVRIRIVEPCCDISGFTENLSARGAFVYTDTIVAEGSAVEFTFTMPSEITLGEGMRVRCHGRVLRSMAGDHGAKPAIAVHFDTYEYLTTEVSVSGSSFERLSPLHEHAAS